MTFSKPEQVYISFDENSLALVEVTQLGDGRVRLEETLLFGDEDEPGFGDIVEVAPLEETSRFGPWPREAPCYRLVRVLERAAFDRFMWIVPLEIAESTQLKSFVDAVIGAGGSCDRVAGGALMASLPKGSSFEPEVALDDVFRAVQNSEQE